MQGPSCWHVGRSERTPNGQGQEDQAASLPLNHPHSLSRLGQRQSHDSSRMGILNTTRHRDRSARQELPGWYALELFFPLCRPLIRYPSVGYARCFLRVTSEAQRRSFRGLQSPGWLHRDGNEGALAGIDMRPSTRCALLTRGAASNKTSIIGMEKCRVGIWCKWRRVMNYPHLLTTHIEWYLSSVADSEPEMDRVFLETNPQRQRESPVALVIPQALR